MHSWIHLTRRHCSCNIKAAGGKRQNGEADVGGETTGTGVHAGIITIIVIFVFLWLIPLFHVSRGGRVIASIEVLILLIASVVFPIAVTALGTGASAYFGAMIFIPMVGAGGVLWFAALFIALFAELNETVRPSRRSRQSLPHVEDQRYR
jgi:hypothetical protein